MLLNIDKIGFRKFIKTTLLDSLFYFVCYIYFAYYSPYLSTLGWSEGLKGIFFALFSMCGIFFAPFVGTLSDKLGRFKIIIFGIILEATVLLGYVYLTNTTTIFFLRILSALAFNAVIVSGISRINDVVKHNKTRSAANGFFNSMLSVAAVIAPMVGGFIADNYGYTHVFLVSSLTMLVILFVFLLLDVFFYNDSLQIHRTHTNLTKRDLNPFINVIDVMKIKELRRLSLIGMAENFSLPLASLVLPYLIIQKMGLSNSHLGMAIFLLSFPAIFQYFLGSYSDKIGSGKSIIMGVSTSAIGLILMFFAKSYEMLLLLLILRSLGTSLWNVSAYSYISYFGEKYNIEGKVVGSYLSLSRTSSTLGFLVSGLLLVFLAEQIFLVYATIIILALFLLGKHFWMVKTPTED